MGKAEGVAQGEGTRLIFRAKPYVKGVWEHL